MPGEAPFIRVVKTDGRTVTIELRQSQSRRARPAKVAGATIFTAAGGLGVPQGIDDWSFAANTTKTTIDIPFGPSDTGDTVHITAFWNNSRDESGPAARPISINLPAGGVTASEQRMKIAA